MHISFDILLHAMISEHAFSEHASGQFCHKALA